MTPQEQQLLIQLTDRINQTQLQEKDPDAQNLLGRELGANPDALYILAQTVLIQNMALEQARAQVNQLQQELQQAKEHASRGTSFLGGLFGHRDPEPQQGQQPPQPMQQPQAPPYQPVPNYQQPQYAAAYPPPQYAPPYGSPQYAGSGQPGFLRGAMQTAAGVAAGALAFEGIESMLHGFGHAGYGGGYGMGGVGMGPGFGMGGGFDRPVEETVVNNYYGDRDTGTRDPNDGTLRGFEDQGSHDSLNQGSQFTGDQQFGNDDLGQGGYDQALADDSAAYDNSVDTIQLDDSDSSGMDSFDAGGGGFDDSGSDLI